MGLYLPSGSDRKFKKEAWTLILQKQNTKIVIFQIPLNLVLRSKNITQITFHNPPMVKKRIIWSEIQNIRFWIWLEVIWIYQRHSKPNNLSVLMPHISASGDRSSFSKYLFSYFLCFFFCSGRYEKIK